MIVLVLNSGSSSLKFQVVETDLETIEKNADKTLAQGVLERIGSEALISMRAEGPAAITDDSAASGPSRRPGPRPALDRLARVARSQRLLDGRRCRRRAPGRPRR